MTHLSTEFPIEILTISNWNLRHGSNKFNVILKDRINFLLFNNILKLLVSLIFRSFSLIRAAPSPIYDWLALTNATSSRSLILFRPNKVIITIKKTITK